MAFGLETTATEVIEHFGENARGKTFLITGPSQGGLGSETAITLAKASPKQIILAGRSKQKVLPVIEEIKKINSSVDVVFVEIDLLDNASVRKAAQQIKGLTAKIDILISNAGVMGVRTFIPSKDGVESTFAACHLGHFLLINLLIQNGLLGAKGDVILNVGSLGYQLAETNLDDVNFDGGKSYNGWKAYGQAKTAQTLFNSELAKRLNAKGVTVLIAHPGVTIESKLLANSGVDQAYFGEAYVLAIARNDGKDLPPQNLVSLQQGAGVILYTALNPALKKSPGAFIVENEIYTEVKDYATSAEKSAKLWELSEKLVGEKFSV